MYIQNTYIACSRKWKLTRIGKCRSSRVVNNCAPGALKLLDHVLTGVDQSDYVVVKNARDSHQKVIRSFVCALQSICWEVPVWKERRTQTREYSTQPSR